MCLCNSSQNNFLLNQFQRVKNAIINQRCGKNSNWWLKQGGQWCGVSLCDDLFRWVPKMMPQNSLASQLLDLAVMFSCKYLHSRYIQLHMHYHWSVWANEIFRLFTGKENSLEWIKVCLPETLHFNVKRNKKTPLSHFFHYGLITKCKPEFSLPLK